MAIQILGELQRDRPSTWALVYLLYNCTPLFLRPLGPRAAWNTDLAWLACWASGRRGLGKVTPRGSEAARIEGGILTSGLICGSRTPHRNPPLAARSRCMVQTPLPGEARSKTTVEKRRMWRRKDEEDNGGREGTIGHFQGLWHHTGPLGCNPDGCLTGKCLALHFT